MIQWQNFSVNISSNCIELENADGRTGTIPRSGSVLPDSLRRMIAIFPFPLFEKGREKNIQISKFADVERWRICKISNPI